MTKKGKMLCIVLLILAFLIKEEIYAFLFKMDISNNTNQMVCEIKNKDIEKKYQELLSAYNYEDKVSYSLEESKILYRDIYNLKNEITIFKGKNNGIQEKNLVINEQGLVGIISKVHSNSSIVKLLPHKDLNLSVKINNVYGILTYENNELVVKGINNKGEIQESTPIYTSDISIYPENILIGYVREVKNDPYEIEKIIKINPAVHFDSLKYVSILTDLRGVE